MTGQESSYSQQEFSDETLKRKRYALTPLDPDQRYPKTSTADIVQHLRM